MQHHYAGRCATDPPSPGDELILYQLLLGAWSPTLDPLDNDEMQAFVQRLAQWQQKALREAKLSSHWLWPDDTYESASRAFLEDLMTTPPLRDAIAAAARKLDLPGAINGLVQTVLRLTVPGVPDLYQGAEFWDYSLVDPDNRRPVDHAERKAALDEALTPTDALLTWRDGRIKQAIIGKLLALRHRYPYAVYPRRLLSLSVSGVHADHIVAFTRRYAGYQLLVVAPRLATELLGEAEQPHIPRNAGKIRTCSPKPVYGKAY
ncbi:hypothetical protein HSBAA_50720 [Vreelandella sulfidaeris]|uniref:(1->4)-alpha-D-glucan 1-alpha-D-glucosylmutase n=1 Tax=Vreelandella sulfidaeris TaxID=115553 RepID=A0A455UC11_9GAMM|nr:hypothetical protein HSBAA_50720 [Halomonas sulfidaeris]